MKIDSTLAHILSLKPSASMPWAELTGMLKKLHDIEMQDMAGHYRSTVISTRNRVLTAMENKLDMGPCGRKLGRQATVPDSASPPSSPRKAVNPSADTA